MISDAHKNDIGNNDDDDDEEEEEDDPGETNVSLACHMYCLLRLHWSELQTAVRCCQIYQSAALSALEHFAIEDFSEGPAFCELHC